MLEGEKPNYIEYIVTKIKNKIPRKFSTNAPEQWDSCEAQTEFCVYQIISLSSWKQKKTEFPSFLQYR